MRTRIEGTGGARSGVSLVMVGLSISVLATLSVAMVVSTRSSTKEKSAQRQEVSALFAAEAGLAESVFQLNAVAAGKQTSATGQKAGQVGSQKAPKGLNGSSYWVEVDDLPNGMKALTSTGLDNRAGMRIELTVQKQSDNLWTWGAFGDELLAMDSNARVDSYDSRLGDYASQQVNGSGSSAWALGNGNVGSNGDVEVSSNSSVMGDAVPGPAATATITGKAYVSGSTTPNSGLVGLPDLSTPTLASGGDYKLANSSGASLSSGDYEYDRMYLGSGSVLKIEGPATVVLDSLELRSGAQVVVDGSGGPVEFFIRGDFVLNSNTSIASTSYAPEDVSINLESDNIINPTQNVQLSEVTFESNSLVFGTIFAPNATIDIDSNFELFGSVVARQVHLDSWSRVHFDEALLDSKTNTTTDEWKAVCWRKRAFQP